MIKFSAINNEYKTFTDHSTNDNPTFNYTGKGTAIIYKKEWHQFIQKKYNIEGRFSAILFTRDKKQLLIGTAYLPSGSSNEDKTEYKNIIRYINSIITDLPNNPEIIIGGDWNNTLNPSLDRKYGTSLESEDINTIPTSTTKKKKI